MNLKSTALLLQAFFLLVISAQAHEEEACRFECKVSSHLVSDNDRGGRQEAMLFMGPPEGVSIPEFTSNRIYSGKWKTPRVKEGFLHFAYEHVSKEKRLFYFDHNCDGNLGDEQAVPATVVWSNWVKFEPVKIQFPGLESPEIFHLQADFNVISQRFWFRTKVHYQGEILVDGELMECLLIDNNANGVFNDVLEDVVRVGEKPDRIEHLLSQYIKIHNGFYHLSPEPHGGTVRFGQMTHLPLGKVELTKKIHDLTLIGDRTCLHYNPEDNIIQVPEGEWRIKSWTINWKDDEGATWRLDGDSFPEDQTFHVKKDETVPIRIGESMEMVLKKSWRWGGYKFILSLKGNLGERVLICCSDWKKCSPKLVIQNKEASYKETVELKTHG